MIHRKVLRDITPNPPNWRIIHKRNIPKLLKVSFIEMTLRPVTLTALAEVNKASITLRDAFSRCANGTNNSKVEMIKADK
jgi:hypothetical protein